MTSGSFLSSYFTIHNRIKRIIFQASDMAKRLSINFLAILYRDIAKTEDFRKRYLYHIRVADKICCLRPTRIRLHLGIGPI
jgi:hypothetical protein